MTEVVPYGLPIAAKPRNRFFRIFSSNKSSPSASNDIREQERTKYDLEEALNEVHRLRSERDSLKSSLINHLTITILPDDPHVPSDIMSYPSDPLKYETYPKSISNPTFGLLKDAWSMELPCQSNEQLKARSSPYLIKRENSDLDSSNNDYSSESPEVMIEEVNKLRRQLEQREDQLFRALLKLKEFKDIQKASSELPDTVLQLKQIIAQQTAMQKVLEKQLEESREEKARLLAQNSTLTDCLLKLNAK